MFQHRLGPNVSVQTPLLACADGSRHVADMLNQEPLQRRKFKRHEKTGLSVIEVVQYQALDHLIDARVAAYQANDAVRLMRRPELGVDFPIQVRFHARSKLLARPRQACQIPGTVPVGRVSDSDHLYYDVENVLRKVRQRETLSQSMIFL